MKRRLFASAQTSSSKSLLGTMERLSFLRGRGLKGIALMLLSTATFGFTFLFSKIALEELNTRSFVFYWMLLAAIYSTLGELPHRRQALSLRRNGWILVVATGLLNLISSLFFFTAIAISPQPAFVSFLGQLTIIPSLLVSVLFLKERISWGSYIGIVVLLCGTVMLTYVSGTIDQRLFLLVVAFSIINGVQLMINKWAVAVVRPLLMVAVRAWISAIGALILFAGVLQFPTTGAWLALAAGAFLGPFLSIMLRYLALQRTEAWIVAALSTTLPLFVAVYDALILGQWMTMQELGAGFLIMIGAMQVTVRRPSAQLSQA